MDNIDDIELNDDLLETDIDLNEPLIHYDPPTTNDARIILPQKDIFDTRSPFDVNFSANDPEMIKLRKKHFNKQAKEYYYYNKIKKPEAFKKYLEKKTKKYHLQRAHKKSLINKGGKRRKTKNTRKRTKQ